MKNNSNKPKKVEEMRAEYDFSGGVRGKHAAIYQQGQTVTIHKKDGTTVVEVWEQIVALLEDAEDAEEIKQARAVKEETISWKTTKKELNLGE
jgi:hypothetical protein